MSTRLVAGFWACSRVGRWYWEQWSAIRCGFPDGGIVSDDQHSLERRFGASPLYLQDWGGLEGTGGDSRGIESAL